MSNHEPKPEFEIGDKVFMPAFTDCFGKFVPQVNNLIVTERQLANPEGLHGCKPYWRFTASPMDNPYHWYEGAARYFDKEVGNEPR